MNVANLDLCRELCNLSSWGDDTEFTYYVNGGQYSGEVYHRTQVFAKPGNIPAYDAGYLLRKLPRGVRLTRNSNNPKKRSNWHGEWSAGVYSNVKLADGQQADTPEDSLCKLAIELFKAGVLTKDMEQKT